MSEDKKEYDLKMQEYAQLLDIRADRIRVIIKSTHSLINLFVVVVVIIIIICLFVVCQFVFARFIDFTIYHHNMFWPDSKAVPSTKDGPARRVQVQSF